MGWYLDGRVTAVVGTHTHVPTADARVLPGGTAYISDVGMTGARGGVIGVKREQSISVFRSHMPMRYDASDIDPWLMAVVIRTAPGSSARRVDRVDPAARRAARRTPAAGTRRGRGRTSAPARAGARSAPRRRARRRVTGSRRRGTKATTTASTSAAASASGAAGDVVEAPDRERRAAVGLEAERAVVERAEAVPERHRRERERRAAAKANAGPRSPRRPSGLAVAVGREQRRQHDRGELRQRGRGHDGAARHRPREHEHRGGHEQRDEAVVGVRVRHEQRERERRPRVGEQRAEVRPAQAPAEQPQPRRGEQVEGDRGGVGGGQVVPARRSTAAAPRTGRRRSRGPGRRCRRAGCRAGSCRRPARRRRSGRRRSRSRSRRRSRSSR